MEEKASIPKARRSVWLFLGVVAMGLAAGLPGLRYDFVADDYILIVENTDVHSLDRLPRLFGSDFFERDVVGLPTYGRIGYYRPLTVSTFSLDWAFFGRHPAGFHFTNAVLNGVASGLVFSAGSALGLTLGAAVAGSVIFAVHPVHAQAVGLINARSDLLCTLGFLIALIGILRSGFLPVVFGTLMAAFSKEVGILLPCVLAGALVMLRRRALKDAALLGMSSVAALLYWSIRRKVVEGGLTDPVEILSSLFGGGFASTGQSIGAHLTALTGVDAHSAFFVLPASSYWDPRVLLPWAFLFSLLYFAVRGIIAGRRMGLFCLWILIGLAPLLSLSRINVPLSEHLIAYHPRWMYLPSAGLAWALGAGIVNVRWGVWGRVLAPLAVVVLGLAHTVRMDVYRSERAMGADLLSVLSGADESRLSIELLALRWSMEAVEALESGGDRRAAVAKLRRARAVLPDDVTVAMNLGSALMELGELDEAIVLLRESLDAREVKPGVFVVEDGRVRGRPVRYALLAEALMRKGELPQAEAAARMARGGDPTNSRYALNLAAALARQGRFDEAGAWYLEALDLRPCYRHAIEGLSNIALILNDGSLASAMRDLAGRCDE